MAQGDALLASFASILQEMEADGNCVTAYLGQDDFAVFMQYDLEAIEKLLSHLKTAVSSTTSSMGYIPAIGIYRLTESDSINLNMYDRAVSAIADAKKSRSKRIFEYDVAAFEKEKKEYQVLLDMKRAWEQGLITFYLQPQCRISTRQIVGAEALARWIEKDGTVISPAVFIPALEKNGFISDFDKAIWEMVCKWIRSQLDRSVRPVPISINISQRDIVSMNVADVLCTLCEKYRVPHELLKVEITESSYAKEFDSVESLVKELRSQGFVTMMDDFGSGYSSLNMLENVSVDVLKLDMIFLKETNIHSHRGVTIVESIINMAKMMSLPIVAEGIETEEQVRFLKSLGCRYAQGYYFYRPVSVADFEKLMEDDRNFDHSGFHCKRNEQIHVREFLDENTFTDVMLNNVLGAVAFYSLDGKNLTITRFNEQFYQAIGDASMEERQQGIQNYVVREDWPLLYRALDDAFIHVANGGICEIRFYKSNGSVFWFRMHFFYLRNEQDKKIFYGQVEDVTEARQQSLQFFEVLRQQSDVSMRLNLDQKTIQYITGNNTFYQIGLPSMDLDTSIQRTTAERIDDEETRRRFREFFNTERLKAAYQKAIYHESIVAGFRMTDAAQPVEFSTYYLRQSREQDLIVYAFAKCLDQSNNESQTIRRKPF